MSLADDSYLAEIINDSAEKISETTFVNTYLPLLFYDNPAVFNKRWLNEVAKNPHVRVYILDGRHQVIYSVPPLRSSPITKADDGVIRALNYLQLEKNLNAAHGARLLEQHLPTLIPLEVDSIVDEDYVAEWKAILLRYGVVVPDIQPVDQVDAEYFTDSDAGDWW